MVTLDKLCVNLTDIIKTYCDDVQKLSLEKLDETADKILDYIVKNCPRSPFAGEHLADSFIKTEVGEGLSKTIYISSKTKSRLVHLIELGFKHRSGKHVSAQPFLRPAYESFTPEMIEVIKRIIGGTI